MLASVSALRDAVRGVLDLDAPEGVRVLDRTALRNRVAEALARTAALSADEDARSAARWVIWEAGRAVGVRSASIHDAYLARGRGAWGRATVPAVNIRARTHDTARAFFRAALSRDCGLLVFEIARSEIGYTLQRPGEYAACVIAAAIREGWTGPVFLQGDHFQASPKKFAQSPEVETKALRDLIAEALAAGFYNIDIDTSTLVDLSRPTLTEQQRVNFELGAELTRDVRRLQPDGVTVSVGGEIGEVGKKNSTVEELRAYLAGFNAAKGDVIGVSKVSVQTGTSHGGVPLPDGTVAQVKLDFAALEELSRSCRDEFGLAGAVQHGASTLPDDMFDRFPRTETAEIHLATGFQNIVYEHARFPKDLRRAMDAWCDENAQEENKEGYTSEQFLFKARKKAWGPFKKEAWDLPGDVSAAIDGALEEKLGFYIDKLGVSGSKEIVLRHVHAVSVPQPRPACLAGP